jgi:hypothetical protein
MSKLKPILSVATFALFLSAVNTAVRAQTGSLTNYVCINLDNGNQRRVASAGECKKNEIAVPWTILKGDKGDPGAAGPQGAVGPQGPQGD